MATNISDKASVSRENWEELFKEAAKKGEIDDENIFDGIENKFDKIRMDVG